MRGMVKADTDTGNGGAHDAHRPPDLPNSAGESGPHDAARDPGNVHSPGQGPFQADRESEIVTGDAGQRHSADKECEQGRDPAQCADDASAEPHGSDRGRPMLTRAIATTAPTANASSPSAMLSPLSTNVKNPARTGMRISRTLRIIPDHPAGRWWIVWTCAPPQASKLAWT